MATAEAARLWKRRRDLIAQRRDLLTDGYGRSMSEPPTADAETLARIDKELQEIDAQLAALETGQADPQSPPSVPYSLEQCKAAILAMSDADRQQLILWIAHGMPKE